MKVFTAQDYQELPEDKQEIVNNWIHKYELENVILVTSQSSLSAEEGTGIATDEDHLAVYADVPVKRYIDPENFIWISNSDTSFNAYVKIAEYFFDDFPWDNIREGN